jgi:predicted metal-binding membrane protein
VASGADLDAPAALAGRSGAGLATYTILVVITAAAWAHVIWTAWTDDMAGMDMGLPLGVGDAVAYVVGWGIMMTAMMLPSASPMIALYAATQRGRSSAGRLLVILFTLVYLGVWTATGVPIYLANVGWSRLSLGTRGAALAAVLVAAGIFQVTPLKRACLRYCRSPIGFLLGHWREGWRGGLALGWAHAVYCLGCCWALMVVLVAAGAMGLAWVLLIGAVVAAEKMLPRGEWIARAAGIALVLLGVAIALRPGLALTLRGVSATM